ncbi:MAG: TonB-dependent receptor [candidate division KSB1 bacterium]|nr:TonB-dependent receptor [candidate division KSB1 bacterium]
MKRFRVFVRRVQVAYPITDRGVIHFSYGIFRQIPDYEQLYRGDELKLNQVSPNQGPFGNPDLNPQRTTMYELGLQQQLSEHIGADVTLFYRDIRDWVTSSALFPTAIAGVSYSRKINRDFANVRGFTLALKRRFANHYSFSVDYTFQIAEGTNSTPEEEYFSQVGGAEPTRQLTPLAWDQRHTLNASFYFGGDDWGVSLIERYQSGQPYTPQLVTIGRVGRDIIAGLEKNSRRKPDRFTVDLTAFKEFRLNQFRLKLFARVFNLFDAKNPVNVFGDTGQPDFTPEHAASGQRRSELVRAPGFLFRTPPRAARHDREFLRRV